MNHLIEDQTLTLKLEGKIIMSNSDKTKNQIKSSIDELVKEDNKIGRASCKERV